MEDKWRCITKHYVAAKTFVRSSHLVPPSRLFVAQSIQYSLKLVLAKKTDEGKERGNNEPASVIPDMKGTNQINVLQHSDVPAAAERSLGREITLRACLQQMFPRHAAASFAAAAHHTAPRPGHVTAAT